MDPIPFGKYLLSERIAEGGMAVVYRAKLTGPGGFEKTLVVKQIRAELAARAEFIELFVKEAKTTVQLTHANIVPVFELGMLDDIYFLALELVDGPPLATLIDRGAFPVPLAAYVAEQVLRGLDYAHRRDIVHRDLSPSNVLCSRDGEVKIVDFGIAAEVRGRAVVGGSRGYVAPEQAAGEQVDARADLYSVGVLLWEMLAGKKREPGTTIDAPAPLLEIVNRALAEKPDARWPTAAAMLQPLTRFLRDTESSTQSELAELVRKRAPDIKRSAPGETIEAERSGPRTRPMARGDATPALGTRAHKEVTFATRFIEGEASPSPSPSPSPSTSLSPSPSLSPAPSRSRLWLPLGALVLVTISAYGGARLRDTVGTSQPIPSVRPAQASAALRVSLDPPNARLAIDGADAITLPRDASDAILVSAGAHTLSATALARPTFEQAITLAPGEQRTLKVTLGAEEGQVELDSDPSGAEVKLGDRSLGTTPTTVSLPLDGPHKLRFERKDYLAAERTLRPEELTGGPPRTIKIAQKLEPLPRGQLTIGARPWAHVTVDGDRKPDTPIVKLAVTAGPHTVRVACPATGKELKFVVQVEAGKEARRVADLTGGEPHLIDN